MLTGINCDTAAQARQTICNVSTDMALAVTSDNTQENSARVPSMRFTTILGHVRAAVSSAGVLPGSGAVNDGQVLRVVGSTNTWAWTPNFAAAGFVVSGPRELNGYFPATNAGDATTPLGTPVLGFTRGSQMVNGVPTDVSFLQNKFLPYFGDLGLDTATGNLDAGVTRDGDNVVIADGGGRRRLVHETMRQSFNRLIADSDAVSKFPSDPAATDNPGNAHKLARLDSTGINLQFVSPSDVDGISSTFSASAVTAAMMDLDKVLTVQASGSDYVGAWRATPKFTAAGFNHAGDFCTFPLQGTFNTQTVNLRGRLLGLRNVDVGGSTRNEITAISTAQILNETLPATKQLHHDTETAVQLADNTNIANAGEIIVVNSTRDGLDTEGLLSKFNAEIMGANEHRLGQAAAGRFLAVGSYDDGSGARPAIVTATAPAPASSGGGAGSMQYYGVRESGNSVTLSFGETQVPINPADFEFSFFAPEGTELVKVGGHIAIRFPSSAGA